MERGGEDLGRGGNDPERTLLFERASERDSARRRPRNRVRASICTCLCVRVSAVLALNSEQAVDTRCGAPPLSLSLGVRCFCLRAVCNAREDKAFDFRKREREREREVGERRAGAEEWRLNFDEKRVRSGGSGWMKSKGRRWLTFGFEFIKECLFN